MRSDKMTFTVRRERNDHISDAAVWRKTNPDR